MEEECLDDVIVSIVLEASNFYENEEDENNYFVAYRLLVIPNEESEDIEGELNWKMQEELSDENLIFTMIGENFEPFRIVDLPNIDGYNFENSTSFLLDDIKFNDAIIYIKNINTISFKDLKSNNSYDKKNYKTTIFQKDYNLIEYKVKEKNNKNKIRELRLVSALEKYFNPESALNNINDAIEFEKEDSIESADSYMMRAEIYLILNNKIKAINDLNRLLEIEPTNQYALNLLDSIK